MCLCACARAPAALFTAGPILVSLAAFSVYTLIGLPLTASVAFPALALFNLLRFPILMFPSQVRVSRPAALPVLMFPS